MAPRPRALVIGGSVGGLFAASLLRRAGWDATVFERAPGDLAGRGAGLGLSAELFAVMRRMGARILPSTAVSVHSLLWLDGAGRVVREIKRGWVTGAWQRIYRPVRDAVADEIYRAGMSLERVEQDGRRITAIFADGTRETGDVLVGADGVHSTVRGQFLPAIEARYAGYVAWRGVIEERDIAPADHALLADCITYSFPEGELALSMPMPGAGDDVRPGHRRYYYIWYRPADAGQALPDLLTDETGRRHASIPPHLIRPAHLAALEDAARAKLAPALAAIIARTAQKLLQPITDLEVPRMVFGRAALMGDAAFIARPHVAAGVTKAALDALALADTLTQHDGDIDRGLAQYERQRLAFGTALVAYSRYLGAYLEAQTGSAATREEARRALDPERLIREYGAPHLIHDPAPGDIPRGP